MTKSADCDSFDDPIPFGRPSDIAFASGPMSAWKGHTHLAEDTPVAVKQVKIN